ncbi:MAG: cupin domain-containing protein [Lachnospiraceae bacterium]|nr:cupin domain-containing protein [Lachnospiraceae bacterium]
MIRKASECTVTVNQQLKDGPGSVQFTNFIGGPAELQDKGRLFSLVTLNPGCGIGYHSHETDFELYYITKGTLAYNDNGLETTVSAGDVTICPPGEGHSITNESDEVCEFVALILYA